MIDREHDLSITKQAKALNISRGSDQPSLSGPGLMLVQSRRLRQRGRRSRST